MLIAIPSLLGISVVLFAVLAMAPGDPFEELATNPNVPAEVRASLRAKFGLDDPIPVRYLHWLTAMMQGDWGFSFASRVDVDTQWLKEIGVLAAKDNLNKDQYIQLENQSEEKILKTREPATELARKLLD